VNFVENAQDLDSSPVSRLVECEVASLPLVRPEYQWARLLWISKFQRVTMRPAIASIDRL